jgi:hypothetical protein
MVSDLDAFTTKTHAELARLIDEAKAARRLIGHRACGDTAPCSYCANLRRIHACIDDHLDQLEMPTPAPVAPTEPYIAPPPARCCGVCGRVRYSNFRGAVCCLHCDSAPVGSKWASLDLEVQE